MRFRFVLSAAAALGLTIGLPMGAFAHTELTESSPADGAQLDEPPTEVVLTFEAEISEDSTFTVTDSDGTEVGGGELDLDLAGHRRHRDSRVRGVAGCVRGRTAAPTHFLFAAAELRPAAGRTASRPASRALPPAGPGAGQARRLEALAPALGLGPLRARVAGAAYRGTRNCRRSPRG